MVDSSTDLYTLAEAERILREQASAQPRFLTLAEVARELRCSIRSARRRVHEGVLPSLRRNNGSHILVSRDDLEVYIARCRT